MDLHQAYIHIFIRPLIKHMVLPISTFLGCNVPINHYIPVISGRMKSYQEYPVAQFYQRYQTFPWLPWSHMRLQLLRLLLDCVHRHDRYLATHPSRCSHRWSFRLARECKWLSSLLVEGTASVPQILHQIWRLWVRRESSWVQSKRSVSSCTKERRCKTNVSS